MMNEKQVRQKRNFETFKKKKNQDDHKAIQNIAFLFSIVVQFFIIKNLDPRS